MSLATIVLIAAVKGSILLAAAWLAMRAVPRLSAALRHLVWACALGGLVVMPLLIRVVPSLPSRFVPTIPVVTSIQTNDAARVVWSAASNVASNAASTPREETVELRSAPTTFAGVASASVSNRRSIDLRKGFPVLWAVVAALFLLRILFGRLRLVLLARQAHVVDDGEWLALVQRLSQRLDISRPVTLLRSSRPCVPMTWGLVYPTVLLPAEADRWPLERRTIVLLHELAHVNRLDAFTQFVAQVATAVFWFNPFAWLAARAMRIERELACDDCVIACGARPSDYAQDLLQIARSFSRSSNVAVAALAMARRGDLEERLMAILDPAANRSAVSRGRAFAAAAAIVVLALPLAALAPISAEAAVVSPVVERTSTPLAPPPQREVKAPVGVTRMLMTPLAAGTQVLTSRTTDSIRTPVIRAAEMPVVLIRASNPAPPDRETLLSVARAAAKLTSSYDKAELLVQIAKFYTGDAELSSAYLTAAASISADYDCARTFTAFLTANPISDDAIELAMGSVAKFTSDYEKANVILTAIGKRRVIGPEARSTVIRAIATIRSDYEKRRAMSELVKGGSFNDKDATDLIKVASGITGSYDKAEALIEIAQQYQGMRDSVRQAYLAAIETITSASDYRRAVEALVKRP